MVKSVHWRGNDSLAKISNSSEEPVFHKGTNQMRSDYTWNKQNVLSLNLSVNGQVGGVGALIKPLRPTATSRNMSRSMCLGHTPWFPCREGVLSLSAFPFGRW